MAFQIKDFASIAASMINWMRGSTQKITDFNQGSVARTLVEAPAAEMDELYQQMFIGLREAIPVSVYNSFDFTRIEALPATGVIRVNITPADTDTLIPAGTEFTAVGVSISYISVADQVIVATDSFADIQVAAEVPGVIGNIVAGKVFALNPTPAGFVNATNQVGFISGIDVESDEARKRRFNAFIDSLNRGTVKAVDYGLKLANLVDASGNVVERVEKAAVIEPWLTDPVNQPISLVNCYVHNGAGSTSAGLVTRAREVVYGYTDANGVKIPGWKAAGVKVEVYAATEVSQAVTAALTVLAGYDEAAAISVVSAAVAEYIRDLDIGETCIRSKLVDIAMTVPGVYNFVMTVPAADVTVANNQKLMPGVITIT